MGRTGSDKAWIRGLRGKARWSNAEGATVVEAWRTSGKTVSAFAKRHRLGGERVRRWVEKAEDATEHAVTFEEVMQVSPPNKRHKVVGTLEIRFGEEIGVRVGERFETDDLKRVLLVLAEVGRW